VINASPAVSVVTRAVLPLGKALQERLSVSLTVHFPITHPRIITVIGIPVERGTGRIVMAFTSVLSPFSQSIVIPVLLRYPINVVSIAAITAVIRIISAIRITIVRVIPAIVPISAISAVVRTVLTVGKSAQECLTIDFALLVFATHPPVVAIVGVSVKRRSGRIVVTLARVFLSFSHTVVIAVLLCDLVYAVSISAIAIASILCRDSIVSNNNEAKSQRNGDRRPQYPAKHIISFHNGSDPPPLVPQEPCQNEQKQDC